VWNQPLESEILKKSGQIAADISKSTAYADFAAVFGVERRFSRHDLDPSAESAMLGRGGWGVRKAPCF
jgi:hypothetical protein